MTLSALNWKTTLTGVGVILTAVGVALKAHFDGDPETTLDLATLGAAVIAGIGLILAKDGDKSSRSLGIK